MSYWTYPAIIIYVYTYEFISERKFKSELNKCLASAPKITGSEGNVHISSYGYGFGKSKVTNKRVVNYMDRCYIAIAGGLRDRFYERTNGELNDFIRHIKKYNNKMFYISVETKRINGTKQSEIS